MDYEYEEKGANADTLLDQFNAGATGTSDVDMGMILHAIIADVQHSYTLAMEGMCVDEAQIKSITDTVTDYIINHYGDN